MNWNKMTIGEYAALERAGGAKLIESDGIWWRQVRPLFYRPLFPFQAFSPGARRPPLLARAGGFQHPVPSPETANSHINFFVFAEPQSYSLGGTTPNCRSRIRRGLRHFHIKEIYDLREFTRAAYPVYLSFYARTRYWYKSERRNQHRFAEWAETLFTFPKVLILGAYYEGALFAVEVSYRVEDVLMRATAFSHSDALRWYVSDALLHTLRERAAAVPDLQYLFLGMVTGDKGLDDFKLGRGAVVLSKPAFFAMNPLCESILRRWLPGHYARLLGQLPSPEREAGGESNTADKARQPPAA